MLHESLAKCRVSTEKIVNPERLCSNVDSMLFTGLFHFEMR